MPFAQGLLEAVNTRDRETFGRSVHARALLWDLRRGLPLAGSIDRQHFSSMPLPTASPSLPKKRKVSTRQHDVLAHIQHLEKRLLEAVSEGTSLNSLVDLLDAAMDTGDSHVLFKCIYSLYRVFASIINTGMLVPTPDSGAKVVRTWIWERLNSFSNMLVGLMSDSEKSLRVSVSQYVHLGYKLSCLGLRNTNPFLPPQAPVVFFVLRPGWPGTFYLV